MSFQGTTRTDPHERSLAHAALISDEWRRSGRGAKDGAPEEWGATVRLVSSDAPKQASPRSPGSRA